MSTRERGLYKAPPLHRPLALPPYQGMEEVDLIITYH
jgi:hypothetical protein